MKKIFFIVIIVSINGLVYANIDVNKCDQIKVQTEKISCLTKLKAEALKENSKEKIKLIENKLTNVHNKIGKGVSDTEKGIKSKMDKTSKAIGDKAPNFLKKRWEKMKETNKNNK